MGRCIDCLSFMNLPEESLAIYVLFGQHKKHPEGRQNFSTIDIGTGTLRRREFSGQERNFSLSQTFFCGEIKIFHRDSSSARK